MTDKAPTGAKSGTAASTSSTQAPSARSTHAPRISSVRPRQLTPAEAALLPPENVMEAGGNFYEHPNTTAKRRRLGEPSSADKNVPCISPATPRPKLPDLTKETMPPALLGIGLVFDEDAPIKQEPDLPVPTPVSPQYPSRRGDRSTATELGSSNRCSSRNSGRGPTSPSAAR
ncbi:hypothetical protein RvY_09450-2 [Ramazzottius varieornatus]|uniref:Uncharacterized protein n=1 Tax=Ramazzottius varieornatus TaxID=947166 RepID=A0A1D1VBT9_RAMVA|nr:hypothetical protein RvY_09450-2 [Ramazzottius varieornatus]